MATTKTTTNNKTTKKPTSTLKPTKVIKQSPNFVSLYVNTTGFGHTRFDFQISLGRIDVSRDKTHDFVEELAVLTMTPEFAKALLIDYQRNMEQYEAEFGEIVLRPHIIPIKPE